MSMDADVKRLHCPDVGMVEVDCGDLAEAIIRWRRGEKREALHQLENALDGAMHGLGELRPEDLR